MYFLASLIPNRMRAPTWYLIVCQVCFIARMWSILVNIPCELEKNIYSASGWTQYFMCQLHPADGWHCWVKLCPNWFSIYWICPLLGGVLKSPALIVNSSISPCSSINFCLMYIHTLLLGAYTLRIALPSWRIDSFIFCNALLYPW